jgi:hypothetical protein
MASIRCNYVNKAVVISLLTFLGLMPVPPPLSKINSTSADPGRGDAATIDDGGRVRDWQVRQESRRWLANLPTRDTKAASA